MTIRVLSFDFDGCLFNSEYIKSLSKDVLAANRTFLDALKKDNELYSKSIAFVGSNRQSKIIDDNNAGWGENAKGSCFPALEKVAADLGVDKDTFLLADIYGNLPDGTSFARALAAQNDTAAQIEHPDWIFDHTKATIIYAQMHKVAQQYPNEEIVFEFFDDRLDIHGSLNTFYSKYPELLPKNVTLRLNHYAGKKETGEEVTLQNEIKAGPENIIDADYRQTVRTMASSVAWSEGTQANVARDFDASGLKRTAFVPPVETQATTVHDKVPDTKHVVNLINRAVQEGLEELRGHGRAARGQAVVESPISSVAPRTSTKAEEKFQAQLAIITGKAKTLRQRGKVDAADAADLLLTELTSASEKFFGKVDNYTKGNFKKDCTLAIEKARPELETHRITSENGRLWREIFVNVLAAVAMAGIGYAIAAAVKNDICLFRFRTDSAKKLDVLEKTVEQVTAPAA